jgi:peptidoglycan/LPS O-acetylase OafA/YrhL
MLTLKCRVKAARYDVHAFDERYSSDFTGTVTSNVVLLLATIALAALSWHLFERPINQLKRLFPYRANGPNPRVEVHLCAAKRE